MPSAIFFYILITLFFAIQQCEATPKVNEFLFMQMHEKMNKLMNSFESYVEQTFPTLTKLQFSRYIYAKIDLLEGIMAEMNAKWNSQMEEIVKYLIDDNSMANFLDFIKKIKGNEQIYRAKHFSKKYYDEFNFGNKEEKIMDELLYSIHAVEFIKILEQIEKKIEKIQEENSENAVSIPRTFLHFQSTLLEFAGQLKFEIVFGQYNYNNFIYMNTINHKEQIQNKIVEIQGKLVKSKSTKEEKALLLKYEQLNDVSLKLHENLMAEIPQMLSQKVENKKTKLPPATFLMSIRVKEAFSQIMPAELMQINLNNVKINLWDYIHFHLCLPYPWIEDDLHRYRAIGNSKLFSAIRVNSAMILLAYERVEKFFHEL